MWSHDDAKSHSTKTWFDVGIFPFHGRVSTNEYLVYKTPFYTLFCTCAYKAMLNRKFYDEHPILHHYPKYSINPQPMQVANEQLMMVKRLSNYCFPFGGHTLEIIAYLFPFSISYEFIFGLKTVTEIGEKSNY